VGLRDRLRGRTNPEHEFAREVSDLIRTVLGASVEPLPDFALRITYADGEHITMNLRTFYAEASRLTGAERDARIRTAVLAMAPRPRPQTWDDAAPMLLPAVRSASWAAAAGPVDVVRAPMLPFVAVLCAIDSEHAMTFVTDDDVKRWGVDAPTVHRAAIDNLLLTPMPVLRPQPDAPVVEILGPDGYASSWLAVPGFIEQVGAPIEGDVLVLAPSRDEVRLVGTADPNVVVAELDRAFADYEAAPRQLSPVPYAIDGAVLAPWKPPGDHPARDRVDKARGVLATVEYARQRETLEGLFAKAGADVFVAKHNLMQRPDGSVWSWAAWVRQVDAGLVPQVDFVLLGDNDDQDTTFCVRWDDAVGLAAGGLVPEVGYQPPLWRYAGWPDEPALSTLRDAGLAFPPP
jgi:hypothetical protein